ncbi:hypothetical protein VIN01S_04430 [Vibrio inusitatus NBRC 102082]|uniref:Uncharacterized protein n=1 Tax=Vibrio inusitatus NBRC 102082 TaxID=1219070 RepID=A0A4Y3HR59_9VIBR|nr:hypothetical protein [Vibrio inusitatus]GEA49639.1 hypothetical protein VIN01S_04430 [Vibrio inusitatus NBRC 102082]
MPKVVIISFITLLTALLPISALSITALEKEQLMTVRSQVFGGSTINAALTQTTISGETPPVFPYHLKDRVLMAWKIKPSDIDAFSSQINLPNYLSVSKTTPLTESEFHRRFSAWLSKQSFSSFSLFSSKQQYYLIADIAHTAGAEQGLKVEWKTFVTVLGSEETHLYRLASFKQIPGNDLLELTNLSSSYISLNRSHHQIETTLISEHGEEFNASITLGESSTNRTFSQSYLDAAEKVLSPLGAQTRYYYDGSSVSARLHKVNLNKVTVSSSLPWFQFAHTLTNVIVPKHDMSFLAQPVTLAVETPAPSLEPVPCINPVSPTSLSELYACLVLPALGSPQFGIAPVDPILIFGQMFAQTPPEYQPTFYYALQDLYQGLSTFAGQAKSTLFFELQTDPKTIFINFEIKPDKIKAFKKEYLPPHFELAKTRFYPEQKKAVYAVSLNLYLSRGANLNGIRAEWSTYIINPLEENPKPRFSVLEAQTNIDGLDPSHVLELLRSDSPPPLNDIPAFLETPNDSFIYKFNKKQGIQASLQGDNNAVLSVDIAYPKKSRRLYTKALTSWMEANDYVYWGEVADILKYDRQVMFADIMVFEATDEDIIHDTTFAEYVKPKPLPIVVWLGGQSIALQPWGNLESIQPE